MSEFKKEIQKTLSEMIKEEESQKEVLYIVLDKTSKRIQINTFLV